MKARVGLTILGWLTFFSGLLYAQEWGRLSPEGAVPPVRSKGIAIYDPVRQQMVIFGGTNNAGRLNDTWALDLQALRWSDLTPSSGPVPPARVTPSAIYDPAQHRMVMWSGQQDAGEFYNDIWTFDLDRDTWTELQPSDPKPNKRYGTVSALDPSSMSMAIFAGFTDEGRFGDTWRFDLGNNTWTEVTPANSPGKRCLHSASFDQAGRRMIIYGGQRSGPLGDIWAFEFQTNTWTELTPADSPPGRTFTAHIYDPAENRAVIFGGNVGGKTTSEVWAFDLEGNTWQLLAVEGERPAAREGAMAIYIEREGRMVTFGGQSGETFFGDVWAIEGLSPPLITAVEEEQALPRTFVLHQNYPNPANPATTIAYELPSSVPVRLSICDLLGREVRRLVDQVEPAGHGSVVWDGKDEAGRSAGSGVYLYRLETREEVRTRKLMLVR